MSARSRSGSPTAWRVLVLALALAVAAGPPVPAQPDEESAAGPPVPAQPDEESPGRDVPAAFAPFEYLVGRWNGQAVPRDDSAPRFRGWPESHSWAWSFTQGRPTGLSLSIQGGKVLATGRLTYVPARNRYRLQGTEPKPGGGPIALEGALDDSGKSLVLEEVPVPPQAEATRPRGRLRLSLRPNANFVRYTLAVDRQEAGAVSFRRSIEVGLTKVGETFAAGGTAAERPRCIVTGGAAAMTLTYQGRTFPICCTGCRDEFQENPQKYLQKASLTAPSPVGNRSEPPPARVGRFDDAFAGDVGDDIADSPAMKGKARADRISRPPQRSDPPSGRTGDEARPSNPGSAQSGRERTIAAQPSTRAASLLRIGQNLEKLGRAGGALGYYRRIIKEYPGTPAATTAAERVQAMEKAGVPRSQSR